MLTNGRESQTDKPFHLASCAFAWLVCLRSDASFRPAFLRLRTGPVWCLPTSDKPELPYMIERRQEGLQMMAVGQHPVNNAAASVDHLTGYLDEVGEEAFEFHPQDVAAYCGHDRDQAIPGFQVPGQRRNDHVSPVRQQAVRRHPQRIHSVLQLPDNVFLVAP